MNRNDYIQYIERALQDLDVDALRLSISISSGDGGNDDLARHYAWPFLSPSSSFCAIASNKTHPLASRLANMDIKRTLKLSSSK